MLGISIVTPTFNRKHIISRSIESSIDLVLNGFANNIIVVDDGSTDDTIRFIKDEYSEFIDNNILLVFRLEVNSGVNTAKNFGVQMSQYKWIAFMDSDDYFCSGAGPLILNELESNRDCGVFFFRCLNLNTSKLIGEKKKASRITFKQALNDGIPGECLPVIKREVMLKFPFNDSLKGCEGITYLEILNSGIIAFVSDEVVRVYDDSGVDRLCSKQSIRARSKEMLRCNLLHVKYIFSASPKKFIGLILRVLYYSYISLFKR